ncbi:unnamed protein product [Paramecium sonneborni]|uniref:Uncharacterized protein n=1 Tax=Paramecium sonneborni TaxID=65129 RepID=A0A8S1P2C6_9CILI|nr:unnamed protein product [Paramecium sonneborni]CAD8095588.1 unnamed protein product [Paramecium sonneborni]
MKIIQLNHQIEKYLCCLYKIFDQILQRKEILTDKKSDKTFKIIYSKQKKLRLVQSKLNDQSQTIISVIKNKSLNKGRIRSEKCTQQKIVKEISLNLEQQRLTERQQKKNTILQDKKTLHYIDNLIKISNHLYELRISLL